jgi:arginyl-tRNA synthetase
MEEKLKGYLSQALGELGITDISVLLEHPADLHHGDWSTNVAMAGAKKAGKNPRQLAEEIVAKLKAVNDPNIAAIEIAGPGFINIHLSDTYFNKALADALALGEVFGMNDTLKGKKVIVEYTDPNVMKPFHIGHLMSNAIGESISRLFVAGGGDVVRMNYYSDSGLNIAKAVWGMKALHVKMPADNASIAARIEFLGAAYPYGVKMSEENADVALEIKTINKKIHERSDPAINELYDKGKKWSLTHLAEIYEMLDSHFDIAKGESEITESGKQIVGESLQKGIFERGDGGAVVFSEKKNGLHTRVFINGEGLPTYEAKEMGLNLWKLEVYHPDISVIITANEQNDYFKVILRAMQEIMPEIAGVTHHIGHGMLRLPTGKMSSRTGDVITAVALIDEAKVRALSKITESDFTTEESESLSEQVAIGAIKYSILRQTSGKDIIFDFEQSLSFEGDSGPYLQYTHARTLSLLAKAGDKKSDVSTMAHTEAPSLHKHILRFPEIVLRAQSEREPHYVATYLIELAREFNGFYGNTIVLDGAPDEPYKLALVEMTSRILKQGLGLLGIPAPTKM